MRCGDIVTGVCGIGENEGNGLEGEERGEKIFERKVRFCKV